MSAFWQALMLQAGYNAALVGLGAALLGFAAGAAGAFVFLRKRALVSDAAAHATLPGIGLAFIVMVALGGDGRALPGLLAGSALSALLGLWLIEWIARRTRLGEDAAIGAVLGSFFGLGIVVLTFIQSMSAGRQAGLEGFLLGATAGMLLEDAVVIALGGALVVALTYLLRRPMTLVAFDASYAAALGVDVRRVDLMMMGLVMAVVVTGLKIVGLILVVALLIIPAATARVWTNRAHRMVWGAGAVGALACYTGAALSAARPDMPTGPIIVLCAAGLFVLSALLAPGRGALAALIRHRRFQVRVHRRQGLLALARGEPVREPFTRRLLRREGLMRADGVATEPGRARAARVALDEQRWAIAREIFGDEGVRAGDDGLVPIEQVFTPDQLRSLDARLGPPLPVARGVI